MNYVLKRGATRVARPASWRRNAFHREAYLCELIRRIADGERAGRDASPSEEQLERYRAVAHLILNRHFGAASAAAESVYDAGIAIGFYGQASAIAVGSCALALDRSSKSFGVFAARSRLLRLVFEAGCKHGRCIREKG